MHFGIILIRIAVDPLFPPPLNLTAKKPSFDLFPENKMEIIFDEDLSLIHI